MKQASNKHIDLELCTDSIEGVQAAVKYGFKRVELCAALELGGLTPSIGMISGAVKLGGVEIHPIIRPRSGGFCYRVEELEVMQKDITQCAEAGASGVVFGVLDKNSNIDLKANTALHAEAKKHNLQVTFHRAFDVVGSPQLALESLIELGFDRILTSGGKEKAEDGTSQIFELLTEASGRIEIMVGSGVNPQNARQLSKLGVDALHFTARKPLEVSSKIDFGSDYVVDHSKILRVIGALNR